MKEADGLALGTPGGGVGGQPFPGGMDLGSEVPLLLPSGPSWWLSVVGWCQGSEGCREERLPMWPPGRRLPASVRMDTSSHGRATTGPQGGSWLIQTHVGPREPGGRKGGKPGEHGNQKVLSQDP